MLQVCRHASRFQMPLERCFKLIEIRSQTANHFLGWQTTLYCVGQGHAKYTDGEISWVSGRLLTDSDTDQRQSSLENVYAKFSLISQGSNRTVFQRSCEDCYVGQWIGLSHPQCRFLYTHVLFPNRFDELTTKKESFLVCPGSPIVSDILNSRFRIDKLNNFSCSVSFVTRNFADSLAISVCDLYAISPDSMSEDFVTFYLASINFAFSSCNSVSCLTLVHHKAFQAR